MARLAVHAPQGGGEVVRALCVRLCRRPAVLTPAAAMLRACVMEGISLGNSDILQTELVNYI